MRTQFSDCKIDRTVADDDGFGDGPDFHTPTPSEWARFMSALPDDVRRRNGKGLRHVAANAYQLAPGRDPQEARATRALAELFGRRVVKCTRQ